MYALEKDEGYLPEFKTCVKDITVRFNDARQKYAEEHPQSNIMAYSLSDDKLDETIDKTLFMVKLEELKDCDLKIYEKVKNGEGIGGEEAPEADGGDGGDGGDDDDG